MSPFIFLSLVFLPFFLVRWVRWLAIVQQKEYRFDRLWAFFHSDEGKEELQRVVPRKSDFRRVGLKRPHPTARVLLVAAISAVVLIVVWVMVTTQLSEFSFLTQVVLFTLAGVIGYLVLPISIFLGAAPSAILSTVVTLRTLRRAHRKLFNQKTLIIGVGGSYGKTSTKHLLHHFLSQKYTVFVTPRSFNTKYSVAKSICEGFRGEEVAILEYGAYIRGEISYLTGWFQPQVAIETGFTPQHLSLFGTRENSLLAEAELIAALSPKGVAFCNGADEGAKHICQLGAQHNKVEIKDYSGPDAVVQLEKIRLNEYGQLHCQWKGYDVQLQLIGRHYATNVQAAIAVSTHLGLSDEQVVTAASSFHPNSSFIQGRVLQTAAYVIDDGRTSNPMGFEAAVSLLDELKYKQKVVITAGMIDLGSESQQIHLKVAKQIKDIGAKVIHLGLDGKNEFREVFGEVLFTEIADAQQMISESNGDTVFLVEGKIPTIIERQIEHLTERLI